MTLTKSQTLRIAFEIGTIGLSCVGEKQDPKATLTETVLVMERQAWASPDPTPNDARYYKDVVAKLEAERVNLGLRYQQAASSAQQADVVAQARRIVTESIYTEIFSSWYGTPRDFTGPRRCGSKAKSRVDISYLQCFAMLVGVCKEFDWRNKPQKTSS